MTRNPIPTSAQHEGKKGVTNVWNCNSSLHGVLPNLCARKGCQQHAKAGTATATAVSLEDEYPMGNTRAGLCLASSAQVVKAVSSQHTNGRCHRWDSTAH
jgi:hypothetical protein